MENTQDVLDVVTTSGSIYRLFLTGKRSWIKRSYHGVISVPEILVTLMVGDELIQPWRKAEVWKHSKVPVIGKHMYVASKTNWKVSKPVVKIIRTTADAPWSV